MIDHKNIAELERYATIGRTAVTEIRRLRKELDKYKRAYAEICHQFNFGDEKDYEDMRDAFLRMVADDESTEGFHEAWVRGKQALAELDKEGGK